MTEWNRHAFSREVLSHPAAIRLDVEGIEWYVGKAACGTGDSDPHWQILRFTFETDGGFSVMWADGDDKFDNVWANRTGLSYS